VKAVDQQQDESDERYKDAWKIADKIEINIKTSLINAITTLIIQNTTILTVFFPIAFSVNAIALMRSQGSHGSRPALWDWSDLDVLR